MPPPSDNLPIRRTRLAVLLVSLAVIALELALMRILSLRFWSHFAYMVISVAILGFGASGTALTLLRGRIVPAKRAWMFSLAILFAVSIPVTLLVGRAVRPNVAFLAWDLSQIRSVVVMELLMFVPFFLAGMFVGTVLMDEGRRLSGHYAANLIGSGLGAVAGVALMYVLSATSLAVAAAACGFCGALVLSPARLWAAAAAVLSAAAMALSALAVRAPIMSQYKMLPQILAMPGTETIHQASGPLGRIDVVAGPAVHFAPGLSLQNTAPIPPHVLLIVDGDQTSAIYDCKNPNDWAFADQTTAAVAYHLRGSPSVCVLGAGGGADVGLALYHDARKVVALEMNGQVIDAMTGPLAERGGDVLLDRRVSVLAREAREYFAASSEKFDVIQFPAIDAFGASGAGLYATQESYLYTLEAFSAMWESLSGGGVLSITRWARTPPRDGLKVFDTAAEALRRKGCQPAKHLAMIRSWATVTVLMSKRPFSQKDLARIRAFCDKRSFDLCYLPGLAVEEANRFHMLLGPLYFNACRALLGQHRGEYLKGYLFRIAAPRDDRPYFFHFSRLKGLSILRQQLGRRSRAFVELAALMLVAALIQAVVLAVVLIVLPLVPGAAALRAARGRTATLGYFFAIGAGFMLLEMAFLQKLILYLGHPIYSAAVVIASFLIFAGLGSHFSRRWSVRLRRLGAAAGVAVAAVGIAYLLVLDDWLGWTQGMPMIARFMIAAGTIAPLAFAMGHMLPTGMRQVTQSAAVLVPWGWAVNGFASVAATAATPLLAMNIGFSNVTLIAVGCYLAAGGLSLLLPRGQES